MASQHPHFCDCSVCLNGGAPVVLSGCNAVRPDPQGEGRRRGFVSVTPRGVELEAQAQQRRAQRGESPSFTPQREPVCR